MSSRIAKRAITETPSHASIPDITTPKNVGKGQLPSALSDAREHKIWPHAPVSLPITDKNTTPIGTIYRSANAAETNAATAAETNAANTAETNAATAAETNAANAAQASALANASNVTHTKTNGCESAHALTKAGHTPVAPAKVNANAKQVNQRVKSHTAESETTLANSHTIVSGSNAVQSHRYNLRPRVPRI